MIARIVNIDPNTRYGHRATAPDKWLSIVGIAPTIRQGDQQAIEPDAVAYLPYRAQPPASTNIITRSHVDPASLTHLIRQSVDPDQPVFNVQTMEEVLVQAPADRLFSREELGGESLVDDDHIGAVGAIGGTERLSLADQKYPKPEQRRLFYESLLEKLKAVPGVQAATIASAIPLSGTGSRELDIEGRPAPVEGSALRSSVISVSDGYFSVMGRDMLRGIVSMWLVSTPMFIE